MAKGWANTLLTDKLSFFPFFFFDFMGGPTISKPTHPQPHSPPFSTTLSWWVEFFNRSFRVKQLNKIFSYHLAKSDMYLNYAQEIVHGLNR